MQHWPLVETDLHEHFGIDLGDRDLLRARSWPWLRARMLHLLSTESRLHRQLAPEPEPRR